MGIEDAFGNKQELQFRGRSNSRTENILSASHMPVYDVDHRLFSEHTESSMTGRHR